MKSHTVPKRLLEQFAYYDCHTKSLRLWKYSKGNAPFPKVSPKTAARIDGYFADPKNLSIEKTVETVLSSDVETPVHRFIGNCDDPHWAMTSAQKSQMTRYVNLLFNRCMARREATKHTQEVLNFALNKFLNNERQLLTVATHWNLKAYFSGIRLPRLFAPEDVSQKTRELLLQFQTEDARQQSFVQNILTAMSSKYAQLLERTMVYGTWNFVRTTDDDQFILSDTPVVTWERLNESQFNFGVGFDRPNVEVLLPLSPLTCLQILPAVSRTRPCTLPTPREVNIAQAAFAHQACFAKENKKELDEIVQDCIHKVQLGRNAFTLWHRNYDEAFFDVLMRQPDFSPFR